MAVNLINSNDINITQTGSDIQLDVSNDIKNQKPTTIWTGTLYGEQTITLSNTKSTLIIYAYCNIVGSIVYTLDCVAPNRNIFYASGTEQSFDTASGLEFYTSESKFNIDTKEFTHTRTGYVNITNHTFTKRNYGDTSYSGYYIYRIDTI